MSSPANAEAAIFDPQAARPAALAATQPFYWSVRRELWEYRSIYVAPLVVAGLVLFGFVIGLANLPHTVRASAGLPEMKQLATLGKPYAIAAASIVFSGLIVAAFYCLGALNNERRDRSILFWKSLPVSDRTTVLSKAVIPLLVLPLVVTAIAIATQLVMLILGSAVLMANGVGAATLWTHWPMGKMSLALAYIMAIVTLWYAPLYAWLLMVSGWARRMPILWAVLPPLGLCIVERFAFDTSYLTSLLVYRFKGFMIEGFAVPAHGQQVVDQLSLLTPLRFLSSPGLWLGLLAATAFLLAAIWLRRYREPG